MRTLELFKTPCQTASHHLDWVEGCPLAKLNTALDQLDWADINVKLDSEGYAVLPGLLGTEVAHSLALHAITPAPHMAQVPSVGQGRGEWRYFNTDMPAPLGEWRSVFYRHLVVIANRWNAALAVDYRYPAEMDDFLRENREVGQTRGQSHLCRLGVEDSVPLHQHNEGDHVFPLQIIALLSEPDADFQGGEWVMTEQRPRMQSRPLVVPLKRGDIAIIATAKRPFKGHQGYYRVNLKHAISRVRKGERMGLEVLFHNAY